MSWHCFSRIVLAGLRLNARPVPEDNLGVGGGGGVGIPAGGSGNGGNGMAWTCRFAICSVESTNSCPGGLINRTQSPSPGMCEQEAWVLLSELHLVVVVPYSKVSVDHRV